MFKDILTTVTDKFDKWFVTNIFFPCFVFVMIILGAIIYTIPKGTDYAFNIWKGYPVEVQAFYIILFLCLILFTALMISGGMAPLIRFYEGYWERSWLLNSKPLNIKSINESRREYYRGQVKQKWDMIREISARASRTMGDDIDRLSGYNEIYYLYPPPTKPDKVMPTRLGNVLASAELYPLLRYNIDTVLVLPRLIPLLGEEFSGPLVSTKSMIDMRITISVLGMGLAIFAALWGAVLYILPDYLTLKIWVLVCVMFFGGLFVCYTSYVSAINSAVRYGDAIKVAFDLKRNKLLEALRLKTPEDIEKEFALWGEVDMFLHRNVSGPGYKDMKPGGDNK